MRRDGRKANELRPVEMIRGFTKSAPGSVLIQCGDTHVLCTASWQVGVPEWKKGKGSGWVTAEYDMLPGATRERRARSRTRIDGRTQEIQRLIGRCMRSVVDFKLLGENTIQIDCDVLQADGGTRTASVTGAYVALCDAVRVAQREKWVTRSPIVDSIAAVSVGMVGGRVLLDLDYAEDSTASVDMNVAMIGSGGLVEVQGTAESGTYSRGELDRMLRLALRGIGQLTQVQQRALRQRRRG
ncbi:MAG: ribonuclease PH [Phycisphaerales bacterium]|nr:ribonuclease PH [Phycisphaerales bacterium]